MGAEDPSLNDGSSRLGMRLGRTLKNGRTLFGRMEWKINLVDNDSQFVLGDSTSDGILVREGESDDVFSTRLGYLGVRFKNIGELTFGKQWSVYYDVASWTDNFNVYGGSALSVFAAGTDGGSLGSGRAEDAIIWRNARGRFSYGLQTQLKTSADGDDFEALGGSLIFAPNDSWEIGAAFAANRIEGAFEDITGDDNSSVATVGVRYHSRPWNTAFSIATWDNHESIFFDDDTLIYDGVGAELYVAYEYSDRLHIYGGFNYMDPDIDDPRVDKDFGLEHWLLGVSIFATPESYAYIEALLSTGKDIDSKRADSVLSAGFRFDF
jgi:predicted porin